MGTLYVVGTPIGNMGEMTPRAVEVLKAVDVIACEDTRVSKNLLRMLDISTSLISYHKFNEKSRAGGLIEQLREGRDIALISDAGMPCVSDPGNVLVRQAAAAGISVIGVSGPCAAITALAISGFDTASFAFRGFLPREKRQLTDLFAALDASLGDTLVFYESPLRIKKSMALLAETRPELSVCLCNDLTKKFERIYRGSPAEVLAELIENPSAEKGEYTLLLSDIPSLEAPEKEAAASLESALVDILVKECGTMKEAVAALYQALGGDVSKKDIYAASLRLKKLFSEEI